jgi:predicted ATP-binding protein involved in virulence
MKVNQLVIQNFRGIEDLTLDFGDRNLIVLIGINGSGKSSILDCLAILLRCLTFYVENCRKLQSIKSGFLNHDVSLKRQDIKNNENSSAAKIKVAFKQEHLYEWSLIKTLENKPDTESNSLDSLELLAGKIAKQLQKDVSFGIPLLVYYPVKRTVGKIYLETKVEKIYLETKEDYALNKIKDNFEQTKAYEGALEGVQVDFQSFFQWFRTTEDWENEKRRDNFNYIDSQLEAVRKSIYSILGEDFSDLRVRRRPLVMTVKKQNEELIVNQLSDGEKSLLAMTGDLARRLAIANPSLSDPCQASAVVLIDEIEQHLHPSWQRKIIPALRRTFPNCQFIITTHSPQVLSQVHKEDIFVLENFALFPADAYTYGRDTNSILSELMDVTERPEEIKNRLDKCFNLIDDGDLENAKKELSKLSELLGNTDSEIVRGNTLIDFLSRVK